MFIDITLFIIFLASICVLWYRISIRLPELIAVPDQVITDRFHEDSAKLRLFVLHLKTYYREKRYEPIIWNFFIKLFYRLHLGLLRLDNGVVAVLKRLRAKGEQAGIPVVKLNGNGDYWQRLQEKDEPTVIPPARNIRIEEVKKR